VNVAVKDFDLAAIGVILMIVGAVAFVAGLLRYGGFGYARRTRSERYVSQDGRHVIDETRTSEF
jgi:hypothetical protein